jgi:hypothetical protein
VGLNGLTKCFLRLEVAIRICHFDSPNVSAPLPTGERYQSLAA